MSLSETTVRARTVWLLAGFAVAVAGQVLLGPPWRLALVGVPLLAVGAVIWAFSAHDERLGTEPGGFLQAPLEVRWAPVVASAFGGAVAFPLFAGNRFAPVNTTLWAVSVSLGTWGLWGRNGTTSWTHEKPRLGVVPLLIFGLVAFFRLADLSGVPANPWSDHAEKLEDLFDLDEGRTLVFFPRNTGREAFQFYWSLLVAKALGTGVSFFTLKLGTALLGLAAAWFVFRLAALLGGKTVGLVALFLYGVAYWPNLMGRIGLRFPLYELFAAAVLYHLYRGLAYNRQRDFVLAGLFLGLGLYGYSPFRVVPGAVVLVLLVYWLAHRKEVAASALWQRAAVVAFVSFLVFVPLASVAWYHPGDFWYRAATRWASVERPLAGNPLAIFAGNVARALAMFNWDDGEIFAICVPHRPALDAVTGALFVLGVAMALRSVVRKRSFPALSLLAVIPFLQLPSTLSLAFPNENPALNRAGAAAIPAFVLAAWAGSRLIQAVAGAGGARKLAASTLVAAAAGVAVWENWHLVFVTFARDNRTFHWDTGSMAGVVRRFLEEGGTVENVHVVCVPHWVDTRLPALLAGVPHRDLGLDREQLPSVLARRRPTLIMLKDDDEETQRKLRALAPRGRWLRNDTNTPERWFWVVRVD